MKLPVHCCCDASKRLGYLDVPDWSGHSVNFCLLDQSGPSMLVLPIGEVFAPGAPPFRAIKSMDTPIEVLRSLHGWEDV